MHTFVAGLPILVLVVLLVLRVRAVIAVGVSIAGALSAAWWFPVDSGAAGEVGAAMGSTALTVAVILFAGIALTKFQQFAGAQQALSGWLSRVAYSRDRAVLLFGMCLVPLIESLIGWGMGVILVLPLLAGAGIPKVKAIQISLLGLMLCPWGSFGPALLLMSETTGLPLAVLGTATAWSNCVVIAVLGLSIVWVSGGRLQLRRLWLELLLACGAMSTVLVAVNATLAPTLGGVLSALAGALVLGLFARGERAREARAPGAAENVPDAVRPGPVGIPGLVKRGLVPYTIVLLGLGSATLSAPIVAPGWPRDLLVNPACWLLLALVCAPVVLRLTMRAVWLGLQESLRVFVPSVVVTLLFIGFGMLLGVNGMGAELAEAATRLGDVFLLLVPLIGWLAGFVTGSNTAAVAMLSQPLQSTAMGLSADPVVVLGLHTAATGAGIMTNPARAVLAIETARLLPLAESESRTASEHGVTRTAMEDPSIRLGRVLAPTLWANAAIVVLLMPAGALLAG